MISFFQLARNGVKNRRKAKKEAAKLKRRLKSEKIEIDRLEELRKKVLMKGQLCGLFIFVS